MAWQGSRPPPSPPPVPLPPLTGSEDKGSKSARSLPCFEALAEDLGTERGINIFHPAERERLPSEDLPSHSAGR